MSMILIKILLYPIALLFALVVLLRNKLFDWKVLKSRKFEIPVISVGNLSYGGTGKTPHIEYLISQLMSEFNIAVLSRGYKRKSRGFILANSQHSALDIGDEPMQYFRKFPEVTVAVDERRAHGIDEILIQRPETNLVLLDDAFQHRYVKPDISILLTDFHNLYFNDFPLPTGTLREFRSGAQRADIIIITKTPKVFSPILRRELYKKVSPKKHQKIFYSYIDYLPPVPLKISSFSSKAAKKYKNILLVCGIANSYPLQDHLRNSCNELIVNDYPDHHKYTLDNVKSIIESYHNILSKDKVIFTTEKDAMRLEREVYAELLSGIPIFYIPIAIRFHQCDDIRFDKFIQSHVGKNK